MGMKSIDQLIVQHLQDCIHCTNKKKCKEVGNASRCDYNRLHKLQTTLDMRGTDLLVVSAVD